MIEKRHKSQAKPDKDSHPVVEDKDITLRNSPGRLLQEYDISKDNMAVTVPSKMILGRML